jgi:hypothetical protein
MTHVPRHRRSKSGSEQRRCVPPALISTVDHLTVDTDPFRSVGRPRTRSVMIERWICEVPPPMVSARLNRKTPVPATNWRAERTNVVEETIRASEILGQFHESLAEFVCEGLLD